MLPFAQQVFLWHSNEVVSSEFAESQQSVVELHFAAAGIAITILKDSHASMYLK